MTQKKASYASFVTPPCVAAFAYTEEPDTHWGEANAKYRLSVKVPKSEMDTLIGFQGTKKVTAREIVDRLLAIQEENGIVPGSVNMCRDGDKMTDAEGNPKAEMAGYWLITGKTKHAPRRIDTARRKLPLSLPIRGGDLVRALFTPGVYKTPAGKAGVTMYLDEVMLVDKRAGGMIPVEDDGFVYDGGEEYAENDAAPGSAGNGDF